MSVDEVKARIACFDDAVFSGPVSPDAVEELQSMFRWPLPADYVEFLTSLGSGYVESEEFVGLGGAPHLDARNVTARLREISSFAVFDESLLPLSGDGGGDYDCIDLQQSNESTSIIVEWSHSGTGEPKEDVRFVATGYWTWFRGILDDLRDL